MATHNVVFLIDCARQHVVPHEEVPVKNLIKISCLKILNYLGFTYGADKVRWGFSFFDSVSGKRKHCKVHDFRELKEKNLEEFENELDSRHQKNVQNEDLCLTRRSGISIAQAAAVQNGLKETLLDYQWDRPDITSPAKPALRNKSRLSLHEETQQDEPLVEELALKNQNLIYLFSSCPHSRHELVRFVYGDDASSTGGGLPTSVQLSEQLLPKRVQNLILNHRIIMHWVDTTDCSKLLESEDHVGYMVVSEVMSLVGGSVVPFDALIRCSYKTKEGELLDLHRGKSGSSTVRPYIPAFPFESGFICLSSNPLYQAAFPQQTGVLSVMHGADEQQWNCPVTLQPFSSSQEQIVSPLAITVKGTLNDWNSLKHNSLRTDGWLLHQQNEQESSVLKQLFKELIQQGLHMVVDVSCEGLTLCTGVVTPLSPSLGFLVLIDSQLPENLEELVSGSTEDASLELPEVVSSVLNHIYNLMEEDEELYDFGDVNEETSIPEWVQQEFRQSDVQGASLVESWFLMSDACGASSNLMESFRLIHAAQEEDLTSSELAFSNSLSEYYLTKSIEESGVVGDHEDDKRRLPRTPVRQKMKTMCRSLQMLNVARLNVKAQKNQPDTAQAPPINIQGQCKDLKRRCGDKAERKGKARKQSRDFITENDLVCHLCEEYSKITTEGEVLPSEFVKNVAELLKSNWKLMANEEFEVKCCNLIEKHLLKTCKEIRQYFGSGQNKERKLIECQLQVLLRLEMFVLCPTLKENAEWKEQLVEEMTDLLRMVSLIKDPACLTKFLEEDILTVYVGSIPRILGELYYSLGTHIPGKLASALPVDFFSDESMNQENDSPFDCPPPLSKAPSCASATADELEELRTRSAKKKRKNTLARHRSITESSQNLRQIDVPRRSLRRESSQSQFTVGVETLPPPLPAKENEQEVTKVRRNLFNPELVSASKRSKLPRSKSVSAVEGMKRKRSKSNEGVKDHRKLLTKKVAETPLHKQTSNRLLHKQIKGRYSDSAALARDINIVEESPEKPLSENCLRKSPRIKKMLLDRRHSGSFYSLSQPKSRSLERVLSASQLQTLSTEKNCTVSLTCERSIQSPKRLLFGAMSESQDSEKSASQERRHSLRYNSGSNRNKVCQASRKTPRKKSQMFLNPEDQKSPKKMLNIPRKVQEKFEKPPLRDLLTQETVICTPEKTCPVLSPLRRSERLILRTPVKGCSPMEKLSPISAKPMPQQALPFPGKELSFKSPVMTRKFATPQKPFLFSSVNNFSQVAEEHGEGISFATSTECLPFISPSRRSKRLALASPLKASPGENTAPEIKDEYFGTGMLLHTPKKEPLPLHCGRSDSLAMSTPQKSSPSMRKFTSLSDDASNSPPLQTLAKNHLESHSPKTPTEIPLAAAYIPAKARTKIPVKPHVYEEPFSVRSTPTRICKFQKYVSPSDSRRKTPHDSYVLQRPETTFVSPSKKNGSCSSPSKTSNKSTVVSPKTAFSPQRTPEGAEFSFSNVDTYTDKSCEKYSSESQMPSQCSRIENEQFASTNVSETIKLMLDKNESVMSKSPGKLVLLKSFNESLQTDAEGRETNSSLITRKESCVETQEFSQENISTFKGISSECISHGSSQKNFKSESLSKIESSLASQHISPLTESANICQSSLQISLILERINQALNSSATNESLSSSSSSTEEENAGISQVLSAEGTGLKMKLPFSNKQSGSDVTAPASSTSSSCVDLKESNSPLSYYKFRSTPSRKKRVATVCTGTPESHLTISTSKFSHTPQNKVGAIMPTIPTYEVELEMQASGLPLLM